MILIDGSRWLFAALARKVSAQVAVGVVGSGGGVRICQTGKRTEVRTGIHCAVGFYCRFALIFSGFLRAGEGH